MRNEGLVVLFFAAVVLFIYLFFDKQIDNLTSSVPTYGTDPGPDFDQLRDHVNKNCAIIYKIREGERCTDCGDYSYRKITIKEGSHVVDGVVLSQGDYCLARQLPECDVTKGFLIIQGDKAECMCRFPQYFAGPSCSTRVACPGRDLIDSNGNVLKTDQFNDYYALKAKCKCDDYDANGHSLVSVGYECIVDPCIYPGVYLPGESGWKLVEGERQCVCKGPILKNRDGPFSPCSNCTNDLQGSGNQYTRKVAVDCANQRTLINSIATNYPCYSLNTDSNCGEMTLTFEAS